VTVKDAFSVCGHPIPDNARIGLHGRDWFYSVDSERASVFGADRWLTPPGNNRLHILVSLASLPVSEVFELLPPLVRKRLAEHFKEKKEE